MLCHSVPPLKTVPLGQQAQARPNLEGPFFKLKLVPLLHDLLEGQVLGKVEGHLLAVEFQKRGLPHVHILRIIEHDVVARCMEDYDLAVSAEIRTRTRSGSSARPSSTPCCTPAAQSAAWTA